MTIFKDEDAAIQRLVELLRGRATSVRDKNLLCLTLSEWGVYLRFLETAYARYQEAGARYDENMRRFSELMRAKVGSGQMTKEEMSLMLEGDDHRYRFRYEIESFYLFAHILLARATNLRAVP
jgi:hypothetical protein